MNVHPVVASVVGQVTNDRWGQVLLTPHAYGVVEIYSASNTAREQGIHVLTQLAKALETPPISLAGLTKVADSLKRDDIVSFILLVPVGMTLFMVSRGKGRVYLKRNANFAMLLNTSQALSGVVQPGDVLILATTGFTRTLSSEEIIGVFDHLNPSEVAEKLTMRLHEKEGGEGGAALIFEVHAIDEESEMATPVDAEARSTPVLAPVRFRHARSLGRRFTTPRQRVLLRRVVAAVRAVPSANIKRIVLSIVIGLFLISVVLGIRHQQSVKTSSVLTEKIIEAQHSFDEGMALLDLNPVKGRERLTRAKELLTPIVGRKLRSDDGQRAARLLTDVNENLLRSMHITHVAPPIFFDVALLKKDASANDISLFEDSLGIMDVEGKSIFALGASSKSGSIVGGGQSFTGATHVAIYGDKVYVLTAAGVSMIRLADVKTVANIIPKSDQWGTISDLVAFGGNLYLLDKQNNRIWKYVATEKGFSEIFEYLNPDTLPDLTKTTNMAIDGSVWLGTTTGAIMRFTSGKENTFMPQGADIPLGNNLEVYTNDTDTMVYVLDSDHHRVVVYDKDGLYMSQYIWDNGLRVSEIVASEPLKKLFLLADGKLYAIPLE